MVKKWKWGRVEGLIFLILVSPLVSLMGKTLTTLPLSPFPFRCSTIGSVGMNSSSSYFPIGSSNMSGFSPKGSSNSLLVKKKEFWLVDVVGVFDKNFLEFSLILWCMKGIFFGFFEIFFKAGKNSVERELWIKWKTTNRMETTSWNEIFEWNTTDRKETTCWIEIVELKGN